MTGSAYFPGELSERTVPAGELVTEQGPTGDVTLQWGTYYDAADQAGDSRHVPYPHPCRRLPGPQHRLDLRPGCVGAGPALPRLNPPYSPAAVSLL
jgi:hypothetical protein